MAALCGSSSAAASQREPDAIGRTLDTPVIVGIPRSTVADGAVALAALCSLALAVHSEIPTPTKYLHIPSPLPY